MENKRYDFISVIGLLTAALLWGISYPLTKYVEDCPTFYILSIRFLMATLAMCLMFFKHLKNINKEIVKYALLLSFCISSMYIFATVGIKFTTSVRASFFTCLSFIIVPILNYIIFKIRITKITTISVLICLVGIFLLSYTPDIGSFGLNMGDLLCILGATAGSLHIIFLDRVTKKDNMEPIAFTILLMMFVAIWSTLIAVFSGNLFSVHASGIQIGTIVVLGVFCSAAAFLLQSICQKYVPSNRVGIILAMEPASGCVISVFALGEVLSTTGWIGAVVTMISLIYMEVATSRGEGKENVC